MRDYFKLAVQEAMRGVKQNEGAPFGACIVSQGELIAVAHDTVLKDKDATCHAEMNAIRRASKHLNTYQLSSCVMYCTSEPCPMCLAAIHWAGIKTCHFIADRQYAARYGFDDSFLYDELVKPIAKRNMLIEQHASQVDEITALFEFWKEKGLPVC